MSASDQDVVVTGIGLTTALGETALTTWARLMAGESAIALRQPFLDLDPGPLAMIGKAPVNLSAMTRRLALAAWKDAGLSFGAGAGADGDDWGSDWGSNCGTVVGSSRSHLQVLEDMAFQQRQRPDQIKGDWLSSLAHTPALTVAQTVGARGPLLAPMAACATGVWAIAQAADLIRSGQCRRAIAGAVESPITRLTLAGFQKMGALAQTGCYPFDVVREGFVLGEGGALLVMESAAVAAARGARVYGKVLGAGMTNDSHHVSAFDPTYRMGRRAVELCLARSGLGASEVDAVHTHGTSTVQNDRMEASLIAALRAVRSPGRKHLPVMASKGATGHTLGASGAVVVALGLMSLYRQRLAPCVGLHTAGFELDFVHRGEKARLEKLLCFSFGFGGQNAALALEKAEC
ncbi:MAG: beta-ketoacyl-ACP synthase [Phormidesmis sp.]